MQSTLRWSLLLLQLIALTWTTVDTSSPYCYRNVTETSYKVVTKSRIKTVSSKGFFKKMTFKKESQVEIYEEQEPVYKVKLESYCCDGYKLSDLGLCEPQCEKNGCPQHSKCVEPEVCECLKGYFSMRSTHDDRHYCEPICEKTCPEHSVCVAPNECACKKGFQVTEDKLCKPYCASGCPHGGQCVTPNVCECQEGYKAEKGSCLPICSIGDQCRNGKCIKNEQCICNQGYKWNNETLKCELEEEQEFPTTYYSEFIEPEYPTETIDIETDINTSNDDIDPSQVFDEDIESSTFSATDDYGSSTHSSSLEGDKTCPTDYVFYKSQCQPLKFVSNEIDCWVRPCQDKHAHCLENGTCACTEGFKWFTHHNDINEITEAECLPLAMYEARLKLIKDGKPVIQEPTNLVTLFLIILGVLVIVSALVFLGFKLLYGRRGEMDVEAKTLACAYDNRACSITNKSVN